MTEKNLRELFSKRIRQKIVLNNINQRELAKRAGLSEVSLSRYIQCKRKPTYDIVIRIAKALNCEPGDLINIDDTIE